MKKLKAYTNVGLLISKPLRNKLHLENCIIELAALNIKIKKLFISSAKGSQNIPIKTYSTRPIYYTRSDGVKTHCIPTHPKHYPIIATYPNGLKTTICLK